MCVGGDQRGRGSLSLGVVEGDPKEGKDYADDEEEEEETAPPPQRSPGAVEEEEDSNFVDLLLEDDFTSSVLAAVSCWALFWSGVTTVTIYFLFPPHRPGCITH